MASNRIGDGRSGSASSHGANSNVPMATTTNTIATASTGGGATPTSGANHRASSIRTPKRQRSAHHSASGGATAATSSSAHAHNICASASSSFDEKSTDLSCPVCLNLIEEAFITKCGHTFCYACLVKSIEVNKRCPKCSATVSGEDMIFPNFLLNDLVKKHKQRLLSMEALGLGRDNSSGEFSCQSTTSTTNEGLRDFIKSESSNLTLPDVNVMLEVLTQRKQLLEAESCAAQNRLLLEFLKHLHKQKRERQSQIARELAIVEHDIEEVNRKLREVHSKCPTLEDVERTVASAASAENNDLATVSAMKKEMIDLIDTIGTSTTTITNASGTLSSETSSSTSNTSKQIMPNQQQQQQMQSNNNSAVSLAMRRRRMHAHFDDFVECYFSVRSKDLFFGAGESTSTSTSSKTNKSAQQLPMDATSGSYTTTTSTNSGLDEFRENLIKFSKYHSLRVLATLNYSSDFFNNSTIVSSIEFDKDNEFLAIAGVTKKIKVFDYGTVIRDAVDIHYPCIEMLSKSKISCVSWNSYHKSILASSDYEGTVTIWDASTGQRTKTYQEHEKRCWSVDFNEVDTRLIASGSDDARVKLYSLNGEHSIATLEAKANVCCVKFNPRSSCHLAFGSADHCVHYYDLRNMKEAVALFKGHKKAVSYVKFLNSEDIVSASTDSQLKLWNVNRSHCLRSFVGHVNEKNFIGLATDGDYIACGSENNALYMYYKGLSKKLFSYKFEGQQAVLDGGPQQQQPQSVREQQGQNDLLQQQQQGQQQQQQRRDEDMNEFVSAVCWKQNSNVVVAANSQGIINILEAGNEIKAGKSLVFWGLHEAFNAVAVVGLGKKEKATDCLELICEEKESVRIAAAAGCKALDSAGIKNIEIESLGDAESAAEGSKLVTWKFQEFKTKKDSLPSTNLYSSCGEEADSEKNSKSWERGSIKAEAQNLARRLADTPANLLTPSIFAERAVELLKSFQNVRIEVRDQKWAENEKMHAFLAVAKGSCEPPRFLEITYKNQGGHDSVKSQSKQPYVLIGKGVTFDAGGISLKPSSNMDQMRADMSGAACVLSTLHALCRLNVKADVTVLIPLVENMPDGRAVKPGDVITARNGKTICVDNTDAEGRLILADALCYSSHLRPEWVLDVATLTGAMKVAIGNAATGVFTNSDRLYEILEKSGAITGDRTWRFPLWKHYVKQMTEHAAYDINNIGKGGKGGGSCTAAAFLRQFVPENTDWLHLDMAGVMGPDDDSPYLPKGMTGRPTRTLIEFIEAQTRN